MQLPTANGGMEISNCPAGELGPAPSTVSGDVQGGVLGIGTPGLPTRPIWMVAQPAAAEPLTDRAPGTTPPSISGGTGGEPGVGVVLGVVVAVGVGVPVAVGVAVGVTLGVLLGVAVAVGVGV